MNPEFQRNIWLELTPVRLAILLAGLVLVFLAAALAEGAAGPADMARWGFYGFAVVWGTRSAARAVVGEIYNHTWDFQRLTALRPSAMLWGKLFGATAFSWAGALLCLIVIVAEAITSAGAGAALILAAYYISVGVMAQAASLLASLIAVGRRQGRRKFELFLYQLVGLAVAAVVIWVADPAGPNFGYISHADGVRWWGVAIAKPAFLLASLGLFAGWVLVGNYRLMRLELMLNNRPVVWLAFLVFVALYAGGFDAWTILPHAQTDAVSSRIGFTALVIAVLCYGNIFLEPKSAVHFRWLGGEIRHGRLIAALCRLPRWLIAYLLTAMLGLALLIRLHLLGEGADEAFVGAALGFLTRDLGVVVVMNLLVSRRSGDAVAAALLVVLYGVMPLITGRLHIPAGAMLFLPQLIEPIWQSPAVAWVEAVAVWTVVITNLAQSRPQTAKG